jgi:primosomal protein N' (replication factor Y) (superfamily II helicase)
MLLDIDVHTDRLVAEPITGYATGTKMRGWIEVLVDLPGIQDLFTYNIPPEMSVQTGDILSVPFGDRLVGGIAVRSIATLPAGLDRSRVKDIDEVIATDLFRSEYWQLLAQIAAYYHTPLVQVIKTALPPGILERSQRRIRLIDTPLTDLQLSPPARDIIKLLQQQKDGEYSWQHIQTKVRHARKGMRELLDRQLVISSFTTPKTQGAKLQLAVTIQAKIDPRDVTRRQQEIIALLQQQGGEMWQTELIELTKCTPPTLQKIAEKGYISISPKAKIRIDRTTGLWLEETANQLTPTQQEIVDRIDRSQGHDRFLLHGVTGSGKTEVYLQVCQRILARGKSVIVLVPEIGLIPQITDRFRARFDEDRVCVYHSALSDGERYDTWRLMLADTPQITIGTRSAIFSPLPNLGAIILDEEHDSSYKQDQPAPTYHARDVAQWRSQLEHCPLILGSATPALDTWVNIDRDSPAYLSLPQRIHARPLPTVEIVDLRLELPAGNRSIFSRQLQTALRELAATGKQGILFIPRRGHSSFVSCRSCGYVMECPHCDVSLSYHQPGTAVDSLLRCHYCNFAQPQPQNCPECDSRYFKFFGSGTQKVMEELERQFPQLRCLRFDSDVTSKKGEHRRILTEFATGEADLLVGTQMLTKGLDLPQVTLVGVVAADGLLHLSDYRAAERTFQTLTQVAGRCGRGTEPGRVIIQTYNPEHPVLNAVIQHDYHRFVAAELPDRQLLNYPPYGKLILLRLSSADADLVEGTATNLGTYLIDRSIVDNYEVLGPTPANVLRVNNRYRWQITRLGCSEKDLPGIS